MLFIYFKFKSSHPFNKSERKLNGNYDFLILKLVFLIIIKIEEEKWLYQSHKNGGGV